MADKNMNIDQASKVCACSSAFFNKCPAAAKLELRDSKDSAERNWAEIWSH